MYPEQLVKAIKRLQWNIEKAVESNDFNQLKELNLELNTLTGNLDTYLSQCEENGNTPVLTVDKAIEDLKGKVSDKQLEEYKHSETFKIDMLRELKAFSARKGLNGLISDKGLDDNRILEALELVINGQADSYPHLLPKLRELTRSADLFTETELGIKNLLLSENDIITKCAKLLLSCTEKHGYSREGVVLGILICNRVLFAAGHPPLILTVDDTLGSVFMRPGVPVPLEKKLEICINTLKENQLAVLRYLEEGTDETDLQESTAFKNRR